MADPEEVDGLVPESVAPNMREIVKAAKLKTFEYSSADYIQFGLLDASQSIAKTVKKSGKAKSAKCCTAIVGIAALRMVNESRPLSNDELTTIILQEAPAVAQKIREDLKIHPATDGEGTSDDPDFLHFPQVFEHLTKSTKNRGIKSIGGGGIKLVDLGQTTLCDELFGSDDRCVAVVFCHEDHYILFAKPKGQPFCELIDSWPHDGNCRSPGRRVKIYTGDALKQLLLSDYTNEGGQFYYFIFTDEPNGPIMLHENSLIDPIVPSPPDEPVTGSSNNKKRKHDESKDGN
jgi:hypothetical protein